MSGGGGDGGGGRADVDGGFGGGLVLGGVECLCQLGELRKCQVEERPGRRNASGTFSYGIPGG